MNYAAGKTGRWKKMKPKKPTYIIALTFDDCVKIDSGKRLKLKWNTFNIEIERNDKHKISCVMRRI